MSTVLSCRGLVVERAGRPVVHGVDLDVEVGRVTALLGANGAGKTTLIEALCGHLPIAAGTVLLDGTDIGRLRAVLRAKAGLATVEQGRTVFKAMTTGDNLRIVARGNGPVDRALALFPELRTKIDVKAGLLSGGEQQMLALARALVTTPKVLVIDEMSLGLAPVVVRRLLPLLGELARTQDIGVLVVEQFAVLALEHADSAYVLRRGALTYAGEASILARDENALAAAYFGGPEAAA